MAFGLRSHRDHDARRDTDRQRDERDPELVHAGSFRSRGERHDRSGSL